MNNEQSEQIPAFSDEQKAYFQRQLREQSGKPVVIIGPELQTDAQRAQQAHDTGDLTEVLADNRVRQAYLEKFKLSEFERQNARFIRSQREKREAEARELQVSRNKARYGIRG